MSNHKVVFLKNSGVAKTTKKRMAIVMLFSVLVFFAICLRFGYWQFVRGEEMRKDAFDRQSRNSEVNARRGTIYDCAGKVFAISANVSKIVINPKAISANKNTTKDEIGSYLAEVLELKVEDVMKKVNRNTVYEIMKRRVEKNVSDKLQQWLVAKKVDGVSIEEDAKRYYPNRSIASQLIGFTNADNIGISGLEYSFDKYLTGTKGKIMTTTDAGNKALPFDNIKRIDAIDGNDLTLTIDSNIQYFAEKAMDAAVKQNECKNGGICIVSDPKTGDIVAMVSKPDFDLNDPYAAPKVEGIDLTKWDGHSTKDVNFLSENVWRNKAISDTYEPGSTFKAFVAASGLEAGVVTENTMVNDSPVKIADATINCWKKYGLHGSETFREAVYNSCNPVFVKVAEKLGMSKFYDYVKGFGFYNKTGITLPGEGLGSFHAKPTLLDMACASFGQRSTVTPIQMVMGYGALANGGVLMKPRLVKQVTDKDGRVVKKFDPVEVRRVISKSTSDKIRSILEGVVSEGTGSKAYIQGYRMAGKTGTSETTTTKKDGRYIASFSSFAPADNPRLVCLVILDFPTGKAGHMGGQIASVVAKKIMEQSLASLEVERQYTTSELGEMEKVIVPNLAGLTVGKAIGILNSLQLKYNLGTQGMDSDTIISSQVPAKDEKVLRDSKITLYGTKKNSDNIH